MTKEMAIAQYPDGYIEECFVAWYAAGRPTFSMRFVQTLPEIHGQRPTPITLQNWSEKKDWRGRADLLDIQAREKVDHALVLQKAGMLKRQAIAAQKIQEKALSTLMVDGFDSSAAAVRAYFEAAQLERTSLGLSESLIKLSQKTDDELKKVIRELVEREGANEIIDAVDEKIEDEEDEIEDGHKS